MWYWLPAIVAAIWVFIDAKSRQTGAFLWSIGTLLVLPFVVPIYLAVRPLKLGERREGGRAWNVLRNFAVAWTVVMGLAMVVGLFSAAGATSDLSSDAERAGAGIGMMLGLGLLGTLWFFPMVGAVVLGFVLKKAVIEEGPTGPLAQVGDNLNVIGRTALTSINDAKKSCAFCAEEILAAAVLCKHCGREQPRVMPPPNQEP